MKYINFFYLKGFFLSFLIAIILVSCSSSSALSEKLREEQRTLNAHVGAIVSINNDDGMRNIGITELVKSYPDFLGGLNAKIVTNEELLLRLKEVNKLYEAKISQEQK